MFLFVILCVVASLDLTAQSTEVQASAHRLTPAVRAVSKVVPSVVNISTERVVRVSDPFESFFEDFFGGRTRYYRETIPLGSGIVVDASGLIITNYHVIQRASQIHIHLWNGKRLTARYVAGDATNDLALLQIREDVSDELLTPIFFAKPDDLIIGETVIAVGNPFGLEHSVTSGVLSAKNRSFESDDVTFNDILQTDASINPGNSGGPLINLDGDLIGINLAIRSDAQGIGFALPLRRIEEVLAGWLLPSRFSSGVCGFIPETRISDNGLQVFVRTVDPDTPADTAGLKEEMRIVGCNGKPVERAIDVGRILWRLRKDDLVRIQTENGAEFEVKIAAMSPGILVRHRLGLQLQELTSALVRALELPDDVRGLTVSEVLPESDLARYGVQRGDIIYKIGEQLVTTVDQAFAALKEYQPGQSVPVFLIVTKVSGRYRYLQKTGFNVRLQ